MTMELPPEIAKKIQERFDRIKAGVPGFLSTDRTAIMVDGSIGYGCYVSPDGDVFVEEYDFSDEPPTIDRSRRAQISVLVLGSRTMPELAQLLPQRRPEAPACEVCKGTGWLHQELFRKQFGGNGILCHECSGLGWAETS